MKFKSKELSRRKAIALAGGLGVAVLPVWSGSVFAVAPYVGGGGNAEKKAGDLSATETLMHHHGVLRRILNIYAELAQRLQLNGDIDPVALTEAAQLFRDMGEDYHERIEEAFIFPDVRKWSGAAEKVVEVLLDQHQRGREITDYLCRIGARGLIDPEAGQLAKAIASMARMYNAHTAWEETVIYPLWKTLPEERLEEVSRKVRAMEHEKFGDFGLDDAVLRISKIESALGLADLAVFTASTPPEA